MMNTLHTPGSDAVCNRRVFWGPVLRLLAGLAACAVAVNAPAGETYSAEFEDVPDLTVETGSIRVTVRYETPDRQPAEWLHCEMKSDDGAYLKGIRRKVRGRGREVFVFTAPPAAQARRLIFYAWIGPQWPETKSPVATSRIVQNLPSTVARRFERWRKQAESLRSTQALPAAPDRPNCALYQAAASKWPAQIQTAVQHAFESAGFRVIRIQEEVLANPYLLEPEHYPVLVLLDARLLPADAAYSLPHYIRNGGLAVVFGGPAFSGDVLIRWRNQWLTRAQCRKQIVASTPERVLLDFRRRNDTGGAWQRSTNNPGASSRVLWTAEGAADPGAVIIDIHDLSGWDTFRAPLTPPIFREGETWTTFRAKADKHTPEIAVEWVEKDGSRWIATVPLSEHWQRYVLPPSAFRWWHDSPAKNRGGAGDAFHPQNAAGLVFGLAFTHTRGTPPGNHRIYIDDIGVSPGPPGEVDPSLLTTVPFSTPIIEGLAPRWKFYPVRNATAVRTRSDQVLFPTSNLPVPQTGWAPHPRPRGAGFRKARRQRFQPLVEYVDAAGRVCGAAASIFLPANTGKRRQAPLLSVPVSDPRFIQEFVESPGFGTLLRRLTAGVFLYEGGAAWYASFGDEVVPMGARVTNRGQSSAFKGTVRIRVLDSTGRTVWKSEQPVNVAAGNDCEVESKWHAPGAPGARFRVVTDLMRASDGAVIDRIEHEFRIVRLPDHPQFVTRRDGHFRLNGRPWFVHGVNYMPSSGIALEESTEFEYWLDPAPYDPEIIERDLSDIARIGFNVVSVFQYYRSRHSHNLLDLLDRCRDHGLKVNLSLRPGTPLNFPWEQVREMILPARLPQNDTVFAYDLAWEPRWGAHDKRKRWDSAWEAWILKKYGTIEAAEKAWRFPAPRENGKITNPTDEQVSRDGPWRRMAVDYRKFLNELLEERYGRARRLVRSIDPNHLVSFRMSTGGDPTADQRSMPYDPAGLARAVDILEPEGYGRIGDWNRVRDGWFTTAYCRCFAPDLPVMWAEFGLSIWDNGRMEVSSSGLDRQAKFYDDFYKMVLRSGADGAVCWWFPGGYRWNERSDYGILNPDRSWRPVTHVIHRWSAKILEPRTIPEPDVWLEFDPDEYCDGIRGVYRRLGSEFWEAVQQGRRPGLRVRKSR